MVVLGGMGSNAVRAFTESLCSKLWVEFNVFNTGVAARRSSVPFS